MLSMQGAFEGQRPNGSAAHSHSKQALPETSAAGWNAGVDSPYEAMTDLLHECIWVGC